MKNMDLMLTGTCPTVNATLPDEEKELAILFVDILNFTGLLESQPGQTVIQIIRRLFTAFNQIVKNFGGTVVEIAGHSLYAVFGLQTELKAAVNDAYQAAKTMFKTVSLFNEAYAEAYYGGPLEIGAVLHSGKVFVGEFGLDNAPKLQVMGQPVNIASRLQAKTRELDNDLVLSEEVYQLLEPEDIFGYQTVNLPGIAHGQQIRLAGKPFSNFALRESSPEMDYLIAIAG